MGVLRSTGDLTSGKSRRLQQFEELRISLLNELEATLHSVASSDPVNRQQQLRELGGKQAEELTKLEEFAERLRAELANSVMFTWGEGYWRSGQLDPDRMASYGRREAVFQKGYSSAQRLLLWEIAMDDTSTRTDRSVLAFSPATARIRLPDEIPPTLKAQLAEYRALKAELKSELRQAIQHHHRTIFDFARARRLRNLAQKQETRIAELEALAENIREGLCRLYPHFRSADEPRYTASVIEPGLTPAQRRLLFSALLRDSRGFASRDPRADSAEVSAETSIASR